MDIKIPFGDGTGVSGSGVSIGKGKVVTAFHVIQEPGKAIRATKSDGTASECTVVYKDRSRDLALLQCDGYSRDSSIRLARVSDVFTGVRVIVAGSPTVLPVIVTQGIICGEFKKEGKLVLDAESGPGGSGGPVFDIRGRLVGVLQAGHMFPPWVVFTTNNLQLRRFLHEALPKDY